MVQSGSECGGFSRGASATPSAWSERAWLAMSTFCIQGLHSSLDGAIMRLGVGAVNTAGLQHIVLDTVLCWLAGSGRHFVVFV